MLTFLFLLEVFNSIRFRLCSQDVFPIVTYFTNGYKQFNMTSAALSIFLERQQPFI